MGHVLLYNPRERSRLRTRLLCWYDRHQRPLPWRVTSDPYRIWISEIMLQQTRVAAVLEHYRKFLERFPDVHALATAPVSEVLAAWSGLGYYRRARHLHAAAREVVRSYGGNLPRTADQLRSLPGFGRYTSAAVASIAFGEPHAVLDGNVERVLRRLLALPRARQSALWNTAELLLSRRRPGDFNQALMELGATVCLPREPRCTHCVLKRWCATRAPQPAATPAKRRAHAITVLLAQKDGRVCLVQRPQAASVMPGMWELPVTRKRARPIAAVRHAIMNTDYRVTVICGAPPRTAGVRSIAAARLSSLPLTGLTRKILRRAGLL